MATAVVTVVNKFGLHARPATKLVNIASKSQAEVFLQKGELRINAKSILGVIMLEVKQGEQLTVTVIGEGEEETLDQIIKLVERGFDDGEADNLIVRKKRVINN